MVIKGGCYCGAVRYEACGEPLFRLQCYCRECQYISGGNPNLVLGMPEDGFRFVKGSPRKFQRSDLPQPVSREFCETCGTHLLTRSPRVVGAVLLKVGTLDDPAQFHKALIGIFAADKQPFHFIPDDIPIHEYRPTTYK